MAAKIQALSEQLGQPVRVSVKVGYTQNYAIYVHENRTARHKVGKAGYLLDPFRREQRTMTRIIVNACKKGMQLEQGLLLAGLHLQRLSQLEVPVDTSALKNSAFTRKEETGA